MVSLDTLFTDIIHKIYYCLLHSFSDRIDNICCISDRFLLVLPRSPLLFPKRHPSYQIPLPLSPHPYLSPLYRYHSILSNYSTPEKLFKQRQSTPQMQLMILALVSTCLAKSGSSKPTNLKEPSSEFKLTMSRVIVPKEEAQKAVEGTDGLFNTVMQSTEVNQPGSTNP